MPANTPAVGECAQPLAVIYGGGMASAFPKGHPYHVNTDTEYHHLKNTRDVVQVNMYDKRPSCPGRGEVYHMGLRYRYTEPKDSRKQKVTLLT